MDEHLLRFRTDPSSPTAAAPSARVAHGLLKVGQEGCRAAITTTTALRGSAPVNSADVVGATLTCTRCRRRFDSCFSDADDDRCPSHASQVRADGTAEGSGGRAPLTAGRSGVNGSCVGLHATESILLSPYSAAGLTASREIPTSEAIELTRRRRERLRASWREAPSSTQSIIHEGAATGSHAALVCSLHTAAGAYHPLQPALLSSLRTCVSVAHDPPTTSSSTSTASSSSGSGVGRQDTPQDEERSGGGTERTQLAGGVDCVRARPTQVDKALLPHLSLVFASGFAWWCSPAQRSEHLRALWSRFLRSLGEPDDEPCHPRSHASGDADRDAPLRAPRWTHRGGPWKPQELIALARIAQSAKTPLPPGRKAAPQPNAAMTLNCLCSLPTPVPSDAITVKAMDYPETAHEPPRMDVEDTAVCRSAQPDAQHPALRLTPASLSARQHDDLPHARCVEALHHRLWHLVAQASGADVPTSHSATRAEAGTAGVLLLPPLCASCWRSHALPQAQAAATRVYADAVDFDVAPPLAVGGLLPQHTATRTSEGGNRVCMTPLWRTAVAAILQPPPPSPHTGTSVSCREMSAARAAPQTPVRDEALDALRTQHAALVREEAELTRRLATLDARMAEETLPAWQSRTQQMNMQHVSGFSEEGGDEARGRLQRIQCMARNEVFVRHVSLLRVLFPIDVNGPLGRIVGLRLGTTAPYSSVTSGKPGPSTPLHTATVRRSPDAAGRQFLLPHVDTDPAVLAAAVQADALREALVFNARQVSLAQDSLSGVLRDTAADDVPIAMVETNTACGYLLQLLVHLVAVNKVTLTRATLHPQGDLSVVDILKPSRTTSETAAGGWFPWTRAASPPLAGGGGSGGGAMTREVERTVDFHLKSQLIGRRTFGVACVAVLGCVKEVCEALSDALRSWRQQQLAFHVAQPSRQPTSPCQVTGDADTAKAFDELPGFPHLGIEDVGSHPDGTPLGSTEGGFSDASPPTAPGAPVVLAHAQVAVTLDPPFPMGEGTIQGFSVQHGAVSEAIWSLAMKKLLANVLWCVQATMELQRLREQ